MTNANVDNNDNDKDEDSGKKVTFDKTLRKDLRTSMQEKQTTTCALTTADLVF